MLNEKTSVCQMEAKLAEYRAKKEKEHNSPKSLISTWLFRNRNTGNKSDQTTELIIPSGVSVKFKNVNL